MDGVHDMGGMHGFGPVPVEGDDEPVFHERWEGRVWAMSAVTRRRTTTDRFRSLIEQMPPGAYLTSSYYERWLWAVERLAAEQGLLEGPTDGTTRTTRTTRTDDEPAAPAPPPSPSTPLWQGRFRPGQPVRVANRTTAEHCRVPRYLRRQVGRVERLACAWPKPAESARTGTYGQPELVYTVVFAGKDLFGPGADHVLSADLGESDLEEP